MNPLLAQIAIETDAAQPAVGWIVVALVLASSSMVMIPALAVLRALQRRREWDHAERLRTLEMGLTPTPRDASTWAKALVCTSIGAGVPLASLVIAALAYASHGSDDLWLLPGVVCPVGVIAGSILAGYLFRTPAAMPAAADRLAAKPAFDPDAYDVAGQRG